jgi:hypothetical protein
VNPLIATSRCGQHDRESINRFRGTATGGAVYPDDRIVVLLEARSIRVQGTVPQEPGDPYELSRRQAVSYWETAAVLPAWASDAVPSFPA